MTWATPWAPCRARACARAPAAAPTVSGERPYRSNCDPVGQPLVVEPRRVDRLLRVHAEVDDVRRSSRATVLMIVRPPGLPVTMNSCAVLARIVGVMLDSIRLRGRRQVRLGADQPLGGGQPGPGVEVAHLVVQQEAGARHDDLRAVAVPRACRSATTALRSPSTTEMCVVSSLSAGHSKLVGEETRRARPALIVARSSAAYSFEISRATGIVAVEVGVAEVARAVGVGAPHRLGHQVDASRPTRCPLALRS